MAKRSKFGWLDCILGLLLVALGVLTLIRPGTTLTGLVVIYSVVAIITGVVDIVFYVKAHNATGFGPSVSLMSGIISILAGLLLLMNPLLGRWIFSLVFAVWFIAHSISRLANHRVIRCVAGKGISVVSVILNILGIVLGVLMLLNPAVSALTLMYLVAVGLVIQGAGSIIEAFSRMGEERKSQWELQ